MWLSWNSGVDSVINNYAIDFFGARLYTWSPFPGFLFPCLSQQQMTIRLCLLGKLFKHQQDFYSPTSLEAFIVNFMNERYADTQLINKLLKHLEQITSIIKQFFLAMHYSMHCTSQSSYIIDLIVPHYLQIITFVLENEWQITQKKWEVLFVWKEWYFWFSMARYILTGRSLKYMAR